MRPPRCDSRNCPWRLGKKAARKREREKKRFSSSSTLASLREAALRPNACERARRERERAELGCSGARVRPRVNQVRARGRHEPSRGESVGRALVPSKGRSWAPLRCKPSNLPLALPSTSLACVEKTKRSLASRSTPKAALFNTNHLKKSSVEIALYVPEGFRLPACHSPLI